MTADAEVDITAPFRGIPRLVALVRYVLATSAPNEADWIEWKVGLDLTKPAGRFAVARQIIGFANRHPSRAALHAGGCSYLVVGAEPGNLAGWAPMDHAKVEQAIRPYVGDDGPVWQPYTVQVDGVDVLVLSVEPPALGDPIHTLRKEYSDPTGGRGAPEGAVLVRRGSSIRQASHAEIKMLQDRLLNRRSAGLEIVVESIGDRIPRVDLSESAVDSWLDSERARLLAPLEADVEERRQRGERVAGPLTPDERRAAGPAIDLLNSLRKSGDLARTQHALGQGYVPEDRDDDDYRQEVEEYISRAREAVAAAAYNEFGASDRAALELRVVNTGDRNLEDVEVVVTFPGAVMSFEEVDADFPKRPRTWGPRAHSALGGLAWDPSRLSLGNYALGPFATPGYIAKNHGSTTIEFDPFHLRPHKSFDLDPVPLVVAAAESGSLTGSWVATARNRDGRAEGTVTVPLDERVFSIGDLLDDEA